LKALLKEPLLHFAVLGLGLFALYGFVAGEAEGPQDEIVVDVARVAALAEQFARARQRLPTASELQDLVDDYVRDEILYREGVALGLDRDDSVVRNRVRMKMEVLADDPGAEVTDADLQAWLDAHRDRYAQPDRYDFRQIFFGSSSGAGVERAIEAALRELTVTADADASALGDATLLPAALHGATEPEIAAQFGEPYAAALRAAPIGRWFGPVSSAYGVHLVRVERREGGGTAALSDIRADVERDLRAARSDAANEAFYERLRARFAVRVEHPSDGIGVSAGAVH
jgi:parvulin-like peptidyl-prolyl isomerase